MPTSSGGILRKHRHRLFATYFGMGIIAGFLLSALVFCSIFTPEASSMSGSIIQGSDTMGGGWSQVHVFYGDTRHIADNSAIPSDYFSNVEWFSQVRQDEFVAKLLRYKRKGYFVDLAANDPVKISNTYALETHFGWNGLCLEPNPMYWAGLSYRTCHTVGAVVGARTMDEISFKFPNRAGPKGGIVGQQFDNKQSSKFNEDHLRFTVTLREIFRRFDTPKVIDYLSLDVEGAEDFIMDSFPFDEYRFNVLTVERPSGKLGQILRDNQYVSLKVLKVNSGETVWIHKSMEKTVDLSALDLNTSDYVYHDTRLDYYTNRDDSSFVSRMKRAK